MAQEAVLIFGTFNPVTVAHVNMGKAARRAMPGADIVYIPSNGNFLHSWKNLDERNRISDEDRIRLLKGAVEPWGFQVDTLEVDGTVDGKTYHTVKNYKDRGKEVVICMGMDKITEFQKWYRGEELLGENRFLICTRDNLHIRDAATELVNRYLDHFQELPMDEQMQSVSATQIREAFFDGDLERVREQMPENVYQYFNEKISLTETGT